MHPFSIESITSPQRSTPSPVYDEYRAAFTTDYDVNGSATKNAHETTTPIPGKSTSPDSGIASPPFGDVGTRDLAPRDDPAVGSPLTAPSKEKPPHSYIALISLAIFAVPEKRLVLSDIYQHVMTHYPYYDNEDRAWRNSIRHNLSLNECFVKVGRAENGKGNYWAVHPACVDDFSKGDYRRRQARRRARANGNGVNVSALPFAYRCNLGYVPMTPHLTGMGYHPYASPYLVAAAATAQMQDFGGIAAGSSMSANVPGMHGAPNVTASATSYPCQFPSMLQSSQSSINSLAMPASPALPASTTMSNSLLQTPMPSLMTSYPNLSTPPTTPTYFSGSANASVRYSPYSMSNSWSL